MSSEMQHNSPTLPGALFRWAPGVIFDLVASNRPDVKHKTPGDISCDRHFGGPEPTQLSIACHLSYRSFAKLSEDIARHSLSIAKSFCGPHSTYPERAKRIGCSEGSDRDLTSIAPKVHPSHARRLLFDVRVALSIH